MVVRTFSDNAYTYISGERTPVSVRMNKPPAAIPADWTLCKWSRKFRSVVRGEVEEGGEPFVIQRVVQKRNGTVVEGLW